ncbi:MAG TPA: tetratricopeptide repeat protein [Myxococcota bacterium]|nr:tetratricopeptide repeat protein [Myxococcota bacterium]
MDDARHAEVTRLLKRGLNHYGLGDLEGAISCWEQARALDPENQAVHDYLETAYEEQGGGGGKKKAANPPAARAPGGPSKGSTPKKAAAAKAAPAKPAAKGSRAVTDDDDTPKSGPVIEFDADDDPDTQIQSALQAYKDGRYDDAFTELRKLAKEAPERLDVQGYLQLVRTERAQAWAKELGDQGHVLRLRVTTAEVMKLRLQPDEGFMLSQIDGRMSIADLLSVSTADRVRTLEIIAKLVREGIVE